MNDLIELCKHISHAFRKQEIEDGYQLIMQFTTIVDETLATQIVPSSIKQSLQQQLIILQKLLDAYDDQAVAQLFDQEITQIVSSKLLLN